MKPSWQSIAALAIVMSFTGFLIWLKVPGVEAVAVGLVSLGGQFVMWLANSTDQHGRSLFPPPQGPTTSATTPTIHPPTEPFPLARDK